MSFTIRQEEAFIRVDLNKGFSSEDLDNVVMKSGALESASEMTPNKLVVVNTPVLDLRFDDLFPPAKHREAIDYTSEFKTAIVVNNDVNFGTSRIWQSIMNSPQVSIEIFRSEEEAIEWLQK
ncbi:MAG: hypothetical protein HRT88_00685 [Lentisphaeraceae bacterium]|nr:hypothetical protein [Lentisphaeraceae bacterium]